MKDKINEVLENFGEQIIQDVAPPDTQHLLTVNENAFKVSRDKAKTFHLVTETFLYIMKRVRPDLEQIMDFLYTIVTKINKEDQNKLRRILDWVKKIIKDYK